MNDSKYVFVAAAAAILVGLGASRLKESNRAPSGGRPADHVREPTFERRNDTLLPPSQ